MKGKITTIHISENIPQQLNNGIRVATHTHMLRSHKKKFEEAKHQLVEWAKSRGITAVGIGSPWEPVSAAHYKQCETVDRDRYYAGIISPDTIMDREPIEKLFTDINRMSDGQTLFYQDNETPKNRHGHLWYVGFDYQVPAWHDYTQDRPVQFADSDPIMDLNTLTGQPHRRRSYMEVIARQRAAGAIAIWAHPTSWWCEKGNFVTNISAQMITHLHADGFLDGMVVQGYDANHLSYQSLWFDLLDRGAWVPGFAELDACFDSETVCSKGTFVNWLPDDDRRHDLDFIKNELQKARHTMTSGPLLSMEVDGCKPGDTVDYGKHTVKVSAWPAKEENQLASVQILGQGGKIIAEKKDFSGGTIEFQIESSKDDYLLARCYGQNDIDAETCQHGIKHCAMTNPVFIGLSQRCKTSPANTEVTLEYSSGSLWTGAQIKILSADARETIEKGFLKDNIHTWKVPTNVIIQLSNEHGKERQISPAMENREIRKHIDYLANGKFLSDFPNCKPGEVPKECFRYKQVRNALESVKIKI